MPLAVRVAAVLIALVTACSAPPGASPSSAMPRPSVAGTADATVSPTRTPSPTPTPSPSAAADGTYLALGDSLAVGVGATEPHAGGYVPLIHAALAAGGQPGPQVTALTNLAISGETSGSMISGGQLAAALETIAIAEPPVAVVTLDIGGNDLLRLLGTDACASNPQGRECLGLLALTLDDFKTNYRQITGELMDAIARHAPDARLAVMTYFNPFSGTDASHEAAAELALLGPDDRIGDCGTDAGGSDGMNDIIACAAEELGAIAVDVHPDFAQLGLELTHIASEDIHANDRGYEVIADAFLAALLR